MTTFELIRTSGMIPDAMQMRYTVATGDTPTVTVFTELDTINLYADALKLIRHLTLNGFTFTEGTMGGAVEKPYTDLHVATVTSWRGIEFPSPVNIVVKDAYVEGEDMDGEENKQ